TSFQIEKEFKKFESQQDSVLALVNSCFSELKAGSAFNTHKLWENILSQVLSLTQIETDYSLFDGQIKLIEDVK
ncbi:MAG: hypothetical protein MHPSP_001885, partial [Paramarteilia canceri]